MRKTLTAGLVIAVACVLATPAQAHWYDDAWDCYAIPMPCEGNLSNAEAVKFEQIEYNRHHPFRGFAYTWAYHRINASATWVAHYNGNPQSSDECLVDIDRVSGVPYRYYINCNYWGTPPKP